MPSVQSRETRDGTRYFVRIRDPKRGKQTSEVFATEAEADHFCRLVESLGPGRALEEHERELEEAAEPCLDDWAPRHFAALTNVTDGTRVSYERIYARTWHKTLGHMRLSEITTEDVAIALNAVPGSDKTVKNAWGVLAGIMRSALRARLITHNPCEGIKPPRRTEHETTEHRYLSPAEFEHLLKHVPVYWHPLVWTLAGTGMRWGEAEALEVGDIDLDVGTVRIVKAVKWDASKAVREVGPTKTKKSRRTLYLPVEVMAQLEPLLDRPRKARLFLPPRSGPLRHKTFYTDVWAKACGGAGFDPRPRIHDLRHSHVAWLIQEGTPLPVIQARLGHEKVTTTIDTYGHLLPDLQRAAADAASLVFARMPSRLANGLDTRVLPELER